PRGLRSFPTRRSSDLVVVMKFGEGPAGGVQAPAAVTDPDRVGFNDVVVDRGGIVRRGLLFLDDGTNTFSSFALRLAVLYLRAERSEEHTSELQSRVDL